MFDWLTGNKRRREEEARRRRQQEAALAYNASAGSGIANPLDPLNPLNPLSPLSPLNQMMWSQPATGHQQPPSHSTPPAHDHTPAPTHHDHSPSYSHTDSVPDNALYTGFRRASPEAKPISHREIQQMVQLHPVADVVLTCLRRDPIGGFIETLHRGEQHRGLFRRRLQLHWHTEQHQPYMEQRS